MSVDVADNKLFGDDLRELYGDRVEMSIDHHFSAKLFARETYVEPTAAAACEILVRAFEEIGFDLTEKMAKCLYTGISTDTGCFQYSNAGAETHRVAARIMERYPDADYAWINRQMFIVKSRQRLEMEMLAVRSMKTYFDDRCAVIAITKEMAESLGVDMNDIEGVANIPLQLETAVIGITMKEREPGLFKVSMRSTEAANVAEICEALGGGGHERAAGCTVRGSLEEARELIIETVRKRAGLF
jgi:phosphoesterase RecJ-like protein